MVPIRRPDLDVPPATGDAPPAAAAPSPAGASAAAAAEAAAAAAAALPTHTPPPPARRAAAPAGARTQSSGAALAQLAADARVARLVECARDLIRQLQDSQRLASRAARKATAEAFEAIVGKLESQRRADPSTFFREIDRLTHNPASAPVGYGHLPAPPFGAVVAYAMELFTETRQAPGVLQGGWDGDMPQSSPAPPTASAFPPSGVPPAGPEYNAYVDALEHEVYLHLFPVTCASARDYKAPCSAPVVCPLCSDFGERVTSYLSKPPSLDNQPPIFGPRLKTSKASGTDGLFAEVLECPTPELDEEPARGALAAEERAAFGAAARDRKVKRTYAYPPPRRARYRRHDGTVVPHGRRAGLCRLWHSLDDDAR